MSDGDDGEDVNQPDQEKRSSRKKKKRPTGKKTTVVGRKANLLNSLPKLEPVDFSTRVNADTGAIDNLFTNVLKENCTNTAFVFL